VLLERLSKLNNSMTSSGLKPATIRLVAQRLNRLRCRMPALKKDNLLNITFLAVLHFQHEGPLSAVP
jgi:hypothetical protein